MIKRMLLCLGLLILVVSLGWAQPSISAEIEDLAKKEGKVMVYTSFRESEIELLIKMFNKNYPGIKVDFIRSGGERLVSRLTQEHQAGIFECDILQIADVSSFVALKNMKMLQAYLPKGAEALSGNMRDKDHFWHVQSYYSVVPAYNTKMLTTEEPPKTWTDLLNPKWEGKLIMCHPQYSGSGAVSLAILTDMLGWSWLEGLHKNKVMVVQSLLDVDRLVAVGERPIGVFINTSYLFIRKTKGQPLKEIIPPEGGPVTLYCQALANKAPHPNASKLFLDFLYSLQAQQAMAEGEICYFAVNPNVKYDKDLANFAKMKLLFPDPETLEKKVADVKTKFGQIFEK